MSRLNKFTSSIHTYLVSTRVGIDLPSNDGIRNSFIKREYQQIDTCADDQRNTNRGICHVYSLPYQFEEFLFMGTCFQGGRFDKVRVLVMLDRRPFEHEVSRSSLAIEYKIFAIATNDFTSDTIRLNCAKIKSLDIDVRAGRSPNFDSYFLLCKY